MREIVLPQQVLAVVISIRSTHNAMNVLLGRLRRVSGKLFQVCGQLVIKFDQDHWTVHAVIERAIRLRATYPSEPSLIEIAVHLVHLHAGVAFVHVPYIEVNQIAEALSSGARQIVRAQSRMGLYV
jgi:hypothetical protein